MRPGRPDDYPALCAIWAEEARRGARDCVPDRAWLRRQMGDFDWEARSRVLEDAAGGPGFVLVWHRETSQGTIARVETAARSEAARLPLLEWGLRLSRAAGSAAAQAWLPGDSDASSLAGLGLRPVRPFWRMDHLDLDTVEGAPLPPGYRLAAPVRPRLAAQTFNEAFAEHWRFSPVTAEQVRSYEQQADLCLLAVAPDDTPAAIVWSTLEEHDADTRSQPVGLVNVVGTVPRHRHHGLGLTLTSEALVRLRRHGAGSASLYVDALNATRAYDLYRRLGFEVAYEYLVFETRW
jgi:ribosomal protein S18 acetylase RimI-like enzyme